MMPSVRADRRDQTSRGQTEIATQTGSETYPSPQSVLGSSVLGAGDTRPPEYWAPFLKPARNIRSHVLFQLHPQCRRAGINHVYMFINENKKFYGLKIQPKKKEKKTLLVLKFSQKRKEKKNFINYN
jgi:hypothetical protein